MLSIGSPAGVGTSSSCFVLLKELQQIWDDIGETQTEKERMLMEVERECLDVYRRKVEEAADAKSRLHHSVVSEEAELASLMAAFGELSIQSQVENRAAPLKERLASIAPLVDGLRIKKQERMKQFEDIKAQIEEISGEISGFNHVNDTNFSTVEEHNLTVRRLTEYQRHLQALEKEKSDRLNKVLKSVNEVHFLCGMLGLDFSQTMSDVHPSHQEKDEYESINITDSTLEGLEQVILGLKNERKARIEKLKNIVASLSELWNLMDPPKEERINFLKLICVLGPSESIINELGVLSTESIEKASVEVERLTKQKASRMKEFVMKKRAELEEICGMTHVEPEASMTVEKSNALIDSGLVDPSELLANIEAQITKAKQEAESRKDIIDRVDRWRVACEEENWLDEYNQDETRYYAGRGAHISLKRAERARLTVRKIPASVDNLIKKTLAWENDKKTCFLYDGERLVSIMEDWKITRQQKEEERKRHRDQKKLQDLLLTEKEAIYGSKPSPKKTSSFRKSNGYQVNGSGSTTPTPRRNSAGSATPEFLTPRSYSGRQNGYLKEMKKLSSTPFNFVALSKADSLSFSSACDTDMGSPQC